MDIFAIFEDQIFADFCLFCDGKYSYETSIIVRSYIMKQNADFQEGISQA